MCGVNLRQPCALLMLTTNEQIENTVLGLYNLQYCMHDYRPQDENLANPESCSVDFVVWFVWTWKLRFTFIEAKQVFRIHSTV